MAAVTGTFTTFAAVGNREDLSDIIYNISPEETPFVSMAGRGRAKATYTEWQTDELATASTSNAHVEGDDTTFTTASPTARVGNYTQIMKKDVIIAGTQEAVDKAGRDSEVAYQKAKRSSELKRDIEATMTGNQAASAGGAATARTLASVEAWIETNTSRATSGASGGFTAGGATAATDSTSTEQRTFTEALLKTVIQSCWSEGGYPKVVLVGPHNKSVASGFTGVATQYKDNPQRGPGRIIGAMDVYVSDFGEHQIVPSRFNRERSALVLDMEFWSIDYLRPFKYESLAKTGDADKGHLITELTLRSKQEKASGIVADLTTS